MNMVLFSFLMTVALLSLLPTARGKDMKGCRHPNSNHMTHRMKIMKGCGLSKSPTRKPIVARTPPTRTPTRSPTGMPALPSNCPDTLQTTLVLGTLYALVEESLSWNASVAAATTYRCCGSQGSMPPYVDLATFAIPTLLPDDGDETWVAGSSYLMPECTYVKRDAAPSSTVSTAIDSCDVERFFVVVFPCVV